MAGISQETPSCLDPSPLCPSLLPSPRLLAVWRCCLCNSVSMLCVCFCLCVYTHGGVCVCVYVTVCAVCFCLCVYTQGDVVCVCVTVYVCVCVSVSVCACMGVSLCVFLSLCACMGVSVCVCFYLCVYTHGGVCVCNCVCCVCVSVSVCACVGVSLCVCESGWQGQPGWEVGPVPVSQDPRVCPVSLLFTEHRMGGVGEGAPPGVGEGTASDLGTWRVPRCPWRAGPQVAARRVALRGSLSDEVVFCAWASTSHPHCIQGTRTAREVWLGAGGPAPAGPSLPRQ